MDISLPNARTVFLPEVPENLTDFKAAVEWAFARRFDNEDAIRTALSAVTTGTIPGVIAIGASTGTAGMMLSYIGTTGWGTVAAGSDTQFMRYDATSNSPVWSTPAGPVDLSPSTTAGSIILSSNSAWTRYSPGTSGTVLAVNSSGLPAWTAINSLVSVNGPLMYAAVGGNNICFTEPSTGSYGGYHVWGVNGSNDSVINGYCYKGQNINTLACFVYGANAQTGSTASLFFSVGTCATTAGVPFHAAATWFSFTLNVSSLSANTGYALKIGLDSLNSMGGRVWFYHFLAFAS